MIRASILGATGYAGSELVRLLYSHPEVKIAHLVSSSQDGVPFEDVYPSFYAMQVPALEALDEKTVLADSDVIFTSLPHGASGDVIPRLYDQGAKVIDLSGDFRYDDAATYEAWYGMPHPRPDLLAHSVYGLPELYTDRIAQSNLIGNPGCYTTCSILALYPIVQAGLIDDSRIIIDAKSGVSGAGRKANTDVHFCEVDESMKGYKVVGHRHTSEIEQELSHAAGHPVVLTFTPHLIPVKRGILATIYCDMKQPAALEDIIALYERFYADQPFVKIMGKQLPQLKYVVGSNYCAIGFAMDSRTNRLTIFSSIDNLVKGAAGQAVQNMNIRFGLDQTCGLAMPAWYL